MNREIKYRAWLPVLNKMIEPKAIWFLDDKIAIEYVNEKGERCIDSDKFFELMQYSDWKDRHCAKIFKDDLVQDSKGKVFQIIQEWGAFSLMRKQDDMMSIFETAWNDTVFPLCQYAWITMEDESILSDLEIIGNIHEHSFLLEEK